MGERLSNLFPLALMVVLAALTYWLDQVVQKPAAAPNLRSLPERLQALVARVEREWDLEVQMDVDVPPEMARRFTQDIYHLVREALTNAARHGFASSATVRVVADPADGFRVSIVDDGKGFAFSGTYTGEQLASMGMGPLTLRERVHALNGSLTLESGPSGASVHIRLPAVA